MNISTVDINTVVGIIGSVAAVYFLMQILLKRSDEAFEKSLHMSKKQLDSLISQVDKTKLLFRPERNTALKLLKENGIEIEPDHKLVDAIHKEFERYSDRILELESAELSIYKTIDSNSTYRAMILEIDSLIERIDNEINQINKRSTLGLSIGIVLISISVIYLLYVGLSSNSSIEVDLSRFLSLFLSRLTLVLFLTSFAIYFLNLYKNGLNQIRSYQSEVSQLKLRKTTLRLLITSTNSGKSDLSSNIISIINAPLNQLIGKDQTDKEIEFRKLNQQYDLSYIEYLKSIAPNNTIK